MLIDIINQGSMFIQVQLLFPSIWYSFVLEKYIVYDVCKLRSPSVESSSVLYITPTYTSFMQDLVLQGMQ